MRAWPEGKLGRIRIWGEGNGLRSRAIVSGARNWEEGSLGAAKVEMGTV